MPSDSKYYRMDKIEHFRSPCIELQWCDELDACLRTCFCLDICLQVRFLSDTFQASIVSFFGNILFNSTL